MWADALGIDCPLTNTLAVSAAHVDSAEDPKQAPSMDMDTVRKMGISATNPEVCHLKRSIAECILLMTYASLRFADVQRLRTFEVN